MGGKWTTYRRMAEDTMTRVIDVGQLERRPCGTESLHVRGWIARDDAAMPSEDWLRVYGSDAPMVRALCAEHASWSQPMHARLPYPLGVVAHAARHEMARSVDDVLARRTRSLLLDAKAAFESADVVAAILAKELGRDSAWAAKDAEAFRQIAKGYQLV